LSLRFPIYRLTCSRPDCSFDAVLPLRVLSDKYLLSDGSTVHASVFRKDGWCFTCNDVRKIFSPKSLALIRAELSDIEDRYNRSGFLGFNKKRPQADIDLFDLNREILDVLRRRSNPAPKCVVCNGFDVVTWEVKNFLSERIVHPGCSGQLRVEEGIFVIGSNLGYGGTTFSDFDETAHKAAYLKTRDSKGRLLDANDVVIGDC